jgi:hypothetical protein
VENLQYLTIEQALADLASFRTYIHGKFSLKDSNKWVAFGGSYPGVLAALLRLKYSNLIHAAVSSSPPLQRGLDFYKYNQIVDDVIETHSPECIQEIQHAHTVIEFTLSRPVGLSALIPLFK